MTHEEIIQAIFDDKTMPFIQPEQLAQIVAFVINNYRTSLPSDLDEAVERIVVSLVPTFGQKYEDGSYVQGTRDYFSRDELIGLVKAGAEWQKERDTRDMFMSDNRHFNKVYELGKKDMKQQMMEEAVEFECIGKKVKMTVKELIDYYIETECCEVAEECGF